VQPEDGGGGGGGGGGGEATDVSPGTAELAALTDHVPVNPLVVTEPSDVNVTLRNPVDERYVPLGTCEPAKICDGDGDTHFAVSHR